VNLSIFDAATEHGGRVGLVVDGTEHTYTELADRARAVDHVDILVAHASLDSAAAIYAALAGDRPLALVHPRLTAAERASLPTPSGHGITIFTSGSTAAPKPVALTRAMLRASAKASATHLGWRDDDRWLCPIPLAHVGGLSVLTRCLLARRCAVLGSVDGLDASRATLASVVPTQLTRMIERDPPPRLRAVLVGGAACPAALLDAARARGYPVLTTYGMTEACSQIATERTPGGGLEPLAGMQVRIEDERILVRGPAVADDGWLDTGDLGHLDERGHLHVLGRADDLIVTGGENVHPLEVERALEQLPAIDEACVFGIADDTWGQLVAAALVANAAIDDATLRAHMDTRLATHKHPRRICFVSELRRAAAGKLDRAAAARHAAPQLRALAD